MKAIVTINSREIKHDVMCVAWTLAKRAAKRFGGSPCEYVNGCLKSAWGIVKHDYERISRPVFIAFLAGLFHRCNKNVIGIPAFMELVHKYSVIHSVTLDTKNIYFHSVIWNIMLTYLCKVTTNIEFEILEPLAMRKNIIEHGIDNDAVIEQCVNYSAMVTGHNEHYNSAFISGIFNHIETCIDECKAIDRINDTVVLLEDYVDTKYSWYQITCEEWKLFHAYIRGCATLAKDRIKGLR